MKKILLVIVLIFSILIVIGIILFFYKNKKSSSAPTTINFINEDLKIKLSYPSTYEITTLSEIHEKANIVFRATRINPDALISIKYEKGLGALAALGGTVMDNLINAVNRRYPERFPDYKKTKYEKTVIGNEDATVFEFTYKGKDNETSMKQRLVLIVKDNNAYYISAQCKEVDFENLTIEFDKVISSFQFL